MMVHFFDGKNVTKLIERKPKQMIKRIIKSVVSGYRMLYMREVRQYIYKPSAINMSGGAIKQQHWHKTVIGSY
jgi:hypothetical protein